MADLRWQISTFGELSTHELYALLRLRQDVFVVEQHCAYLDLDNLDLEAVHMQCWRGQELAAYQRMLKPGLAFPESSIGRIVVASTARGLKLGRELVSKGIDFNNREWPESNIQIGAQAHLAEFYQSLGFEPVGQQYIEDGIAHIHMIRSREGK